MDLTGDVFQSIASSEKHLERQEIYQSLQNRIKSESADDVGITYDDIVQLEGAYPGIFTRFSGSHSFHLGTPQENAAVIMEAVEHGALLKAGVLAAVLTLIYKIIKVFINNSDFQGNNARGGETHTRTIRDETREVLVELDAQSKKLVPQLTELKKDPAKRELNDKSGRLADAILGLASGQGYPKESGLSSEKLDLLIQTLGDNYPFHTGSMAAFIAIIDNGDFVEFINTSKSLIATLRDESDRIVNFLATSVSLLANLKNRSVEAAVTAINNGDISTQIDEHAKRVGKSLFRVNVDGLAHLKGMMNQLEGYKEILKMTLAEADEKKDGRFHSAQSFSKIYYDSSDKFYQHRLVSMVRLNEEFKKLLDRVPDLKNQDIYQTSIELNTSIDEMVANFRANKSEGSQDAISDLLKLKDLNKIYFEHILANATSYRRKADTVTASMTKSLEILKKLLTKVEETTKELEDGELI